MGSEHDDLKTERDALKSCIEKMYKDSSAINQRSESTYLNIIGAMLELMLSSSLAGQKHSIFVNQSAIISALLGYHSDKLGISDRTLESKFAEAKKASLHTKVPQLRFDLPQLRLHIIVFTPK